MKESDDNSRFERFRSRGDVKALGEVFDSLAPELLAVARRLVAGANEAEDLVQATFVTAIEKASEYDEERAVAPWMVGILAGHAANLRRKRARLVESTQEPVAGASSGPSEAAERRELSSELQRALASLPSGYREALEPYLSDGSKPREIAARLGITPNAARVRVHRGLELLRVALPAGLAAGAASSVATGRGLGPVREYVLSEASRQALRVAVAGRSAGWLGHVLATQRFVLGVAAAVAIALTIALTVGMWPVTPEALELPSIAAPAAAALSTPEALRPPVEAAREERVTAPAQRSVAAATTRYRGRVVQLLGDAPIEGARVWTELDSSRERTLRAVTDASGRFEFDGARGEDLTLAVEADGFATRRPPLSLERRERFWSDSGRVERDGESVIDLYTFRLLRGAELLGRVVDRNDVGVVGAQLVLCEVVAGTLQTFDEHPIGRSGVDGAIELNGLLPKSIADDGRHWILFASHPSGVGWTRIAAPANRDRIEDVRIVLDQGLTIDVVLRDLSGQPIEGAVVTLTPMHDPFPPLTGLQYELLPLAPVLAALHTATSDAKGVARIANAVRSKSATPGAMACQFVVQVELDGRVLYRASRPMGCDSPARLQLQLAREPAPIVVRGRVVDLEGRPLADAQVRVRKTAGADLVATTSARDGRFELQLALTAPDLLDVLASSPGYATHAQSFDRGSREGLPREVELVLGPSQSIAGRVVDDSGRPVSDVTVYAFGGVRWTSEPGDEATTDASGRFVIRDLIEGVHSLSAFVESESELEQREPVVARTGERDALVVLHRRAERPTASVELEVVDELSGDALDAVGAALLAVDPSASSSMAPRFATGLATFDDVEPGRYVAWVSVAGRATAHVDVEVAEHESLVRVRAPIGSLGAIDGRIDAPASPRPNKIWIRAEIRTASGSVPGGPEFGGGGSFSCSVVARADGAFELPQLAPGRWSVTAEALGLLCETVEVDVASGARAQVLLRAESSCVLELRLERTLGRGWARIELAQGDGPWVVQPLLWNGAMDASNPILVNVAPGRSRWRVSFVSTPTRDATDEFLAAAEGEFDARAGAVVRSVVPVREL